MKCFLSTGQIHFDDINQDKDYWPWRSYAQSKLANVLFTRELANRLQGAASVLYLYFYVSLHIEWDFMSL